MFSELLQRESRFPPLVGVGLAAALLASVAVASAQASLPSHRERSTWDEVPATGMAKAAGALVDTGAVQLAAAQFAFVQPLEGFGVNSPFGLRRMPWEAGGRLHEGVDIAAPSGTPVRSTLAGTVIRSGTDGGYGRFIEVRHEGGLTSLYAHLGRHAGLKAGAPIAAGTVVGYVGNSGRSTGSHLHFEVRHDGRPLNPAAFIGRTFATAEDLPLKLASYIPRKVRVAQVSEWPESLRPRQKGETAADKPVVLAQAGKDGRVRAVIGPAAGAADGSRAVTISPTAAAGIAATVRAASPAAVKAAPVAAPAPAPTGVSSDASAREVVSTAPAA